MVKSFRLNKIVTLSDEQAQNLANTPMNVAAHVFVELAKWRNQSGSCPQQYFTKEQLSQADKSRQLGYYNKSN